MQDAGPARGALEALRALDERIDRLAERLREVVEERDSVLREIEGLRARSAELESAAGRGATADAAWRRRTDEVGAVLRTALEELRAD